MKFALSIYLCLLISASAALFVGTRRMDVGATVQYSTNAYAGLTNNFSFDPTTNSSGWSFNGIVSNSASAISWDVAQSNLLYSHPSGSSGQKAAIMYSNSASPYGVWTMSASITKDAWSCNMGARNGTQYLSPVTFQDYFVTTGNGATTMVLTGIFTGSWELVFVGFNAGGAQTARVYSIAVDGPTNYVITNLLSETVGDLLVNSTFTYSNNVLKAVPLR